MAKKDTRKQTQKETKNHTKNSGSQKAADLQKQIEELQNELAQSHESRARAMADLQNYRRLVEEQKAQFGLMANMGIVRGILEVLDEVQMAMNDNEIDIDRAKQVISIFDEKLTNILSTNGVEKIAVKRGDKFDPATMEAITTVPSSDEHATGTIVEVISCAYKYANQDQLLQHAKVVIAK